MPENPTGSAGWQIAKDSFDANFVMDICSEHIMLHILNGTNTAFSSIEVTRLSCSTTKSVNIVPQ